MKIAPKNNILLLLTSLLVTSVNAAAPGPPTPPPPAPPPGFPIDQNLMLLAILAIVLAIYKFRDFKIVSK